MPELPDLEAFSGNLQKKLKGRVVTEINVLHAAKLNVSPKELESTLKGQSVKDVSRQGKELWFTFSGGDVLSLHLMLHGGLAFLEKGNSARHTILEIHFSEGPGLILTDFQKSAKPTLNPPEPQAPDALSPEADYSFFKEMLNRRTKIKTVLMDQKVVRGIGNAYADEILWEARIHPESTSDKVPDDKIRDLVKAIKAVSRNAVKNILKVEPGIISGEIREFLKIHHPRKKTSPSGAEIRSMQLASRKTYFTEEQILYK